MQQQIKGNKTTIGKKQYFREMRETWKHTRKYMLQKLSQLAFNNKEAVLALQENPVVKKRLSARNPKVRPFLMKLSFEVCRGGDWKRIIPACAAVEFLNISTYVTNAVFDEKGGKKSKKDINQYIIAAMLTRDLAAECLSEVKVSLSQEEIMEMHQKLTEINKIIYLGQYIDLFKLKKENINNFKSFEEIKKLYMERAEMFCGYFMGNIAFIGALLANATREQIGTLEEIGFAYGTGLQIANDIGDFVLGDSEAKDFEKDYQDQYSDIRHGKLTYPVILGLEMKEKNIIRNLLGKKKSNYKQLHSLTGFLVKSGIVEKTKQLVNVKHNECKKELKKLPESKARKMLSLMVSGVRSNKYFVFFREFEKPYFNKKLGHK